MFVDGGSFIGDTVQEFIKQSGGQYGKIICMEPNNENVKSIREMIEKYYISNVDVFPFGLSDKKVTLSFDSSSAMGGRILEDGENQVECDSIDNLCYDKYPRIDFIKMDIEGSEYWALKGARKVIERDHPKLAICVYHKKDDFYVLTRLIKDLYSGYKLYFRQYELSAEETVCYAIP